MRIFKSIYSGERTLEDAEKEQENLVRINQGPPYYQSFEQMNIIEKVRNLYN